MEKVKENKEKLVIDEAKAPTWAKYEDQARQAPGAKLVSTSFKGKEKRIFKKNKVVLRVSESEAIPSKYEEGDEANTVVSFDKSRKEDSSRGRISQLDNKHTSNKGYFEHMAVRVDENRSKSLIKRKGKEKVVDIAIWG